MNKFIDHRENIFCTQRKSLLLLVVCIITAVGVLASCYSRSIGMIGGADGPTAIYVSNSLEKLYESRIKYIGDNSGVSNILNLVFAGSQPIKDFELKTSDGEPKGVIVNFTGKCGEDVFREAKAATVLFLIENCDYIELSYEDQAVNYKKASVEAEYGVKFTDIAASFDDFSEFYLNILGASSAIPIESRLATLIIQQNLGGYLRGECSAEGHIIIGTEGGVLAGKETDKPDTEIIYALVSYGEYGFENGIFTKISGSGVIPTRITFDKDGKITEYLEASDGSDYAPSIKKMFPEGLWRRAMAGDKTDYEECVKQERVYAEKYLKSIGRDAKIMEYSDFEHKLPDMDTEASNKILDMYGEYPYWIGTSEKLEDGVRYVYEKQWDSKSKIATFKKYEYNTNKIIEEVIIDTSGGNLKYIKGTPREENHSK